MPTLRWWWRLNWCSLHWWWWWLCLWWYCWLCWSCLLLLLESIHTRKCRTSPSLHVVRKGVLTQPTKAKWISERRGKKSSTKHAIPHLPIRVRRCKQTHSHCRWWWCIIACSKTCEIREKIIKCEFVLPFLKFKNCCSITQSSIK